MSKDFETIVRDCSYTAEAFCDVYYKTIDTRRHHMIRLYLDSGILAWNGNESRGKESIQTFLNALPNSNHEVSTLDAKPISEEIVGGQVTHIIQAGGIVKYSGQKEQQFQQTFMITAEGQNWKIVSDAYRLQDGYARAKSENE